ncbi:MAG: hypothetical protein XE01_1257 [Synergistales bacterium 58_81]|nr:MAG: hypothetical protein XE01_1257 [Synergistales bacterium 58_81]
MRNKMLIIAVLLAVVAFTGFRVAAAPSEEGLRMSPEARAEIAEMGNEATLALVVLSSG